MVIVAQLGDDEEMFPLYAACLNHLMYALTNSLFVTIHFSIIDMLQAALVVRLYV